MKLTTLTVMLMSCVLALAFSPAHAAKLSDADKAWIDKCVSDRKASKAKPGALRKYCVCMHDVVDNNQPFEITELERTYPPVHRQCWKQAGRRAP